MAPSAFGDALLGAIASDTDRLAIIGATGEGWSRGDLAAAIAQVGTALRSAGFGAGARVAIAIPDGPLAAVTILAVACHAVAIPLPDDTDAATVRWIDAIQPDLVITAEVRRPLREALQERGISAAMLSGSGPQARLMVMEDRAVGGDQPGRSGIAFLMLTSGSTGVPKQIPRTGENVVTATTTYGHAIGLHPDDRALTAMPLHHSHGLMAGVVMPLLLGGSTVVLSGMEVHGIGRALAERQPTWMTGGPALHQRVLARLGGEQVPGLRFVRCASDRLTPELQVRLAEAYRAPVITSYGVTECPFATAQHPEVPIDPDGVGVPIVDLAVLDRNWQPVAIGEIGAIGVRGAAVSPVGRVGDGWYLPGDLGQLLPSGALRYVGRTREAIRRGSEEIDPGAIEAVIGGLDGVAEVAVFPLEHEVLGEDIGAAVVLRSGREVTARDVRQAVLRGLPASCVPRRIWVVAALPTTSTGKIARAMVREAAERDGELLG